MGVENQAANRCRRGPDEPAAGDVSTISQSYTVFGQIRKAYNLDNIQGYKYDLIGRLVSVYDYNTAVSPTTCTRRDYGYDADSNRTSQTTYSTVTTADCSGSTPTTVNHTYDTADRELDTGYTYGAFGSTLTVPSVDAGGGGTLTLGYNADNRVTSESQGSTTKSYSYDSQERLRVTTTGTRTTTQHYDSGTSSGGESPAWTLVSDGTSTTRYVSGPDGNLDLEQINSGTVTLELADPHGNVVATMPDVASATVSALSEQTEFGSTRSGQTALTASGPDNYGWLGGKQRDLDSLGGLVLMGERLYNPASGRFLQVDPVPGGSANDYDYCSQDPINCFDLNGQWGWHSVKHWVNSHKTFIASTATFGAGVACLLGGPLGCGIAEGVAYGARVWKEGWSSREAITSDAVDGFATVATFGVMAGAGAGIKYAERSSAKAAEAGVGKAWEAPKSFDYALRGIGIFPDAINSGGVSASGHGWADRAE